MTLEIALCPGCLVMLNRPSTEFSLGFRADRLEWCFWRCAPPLCYVYRLELPPYQVLALRCNRKLRRGNENRAVVIQSSILMKSTPLW